MFHILRGGRSAGRSVLESVVELVGLSVGRALSIEQAKMGANVASESVVYEGLFAAVPYLTRCTNGVRLRCVSYAVKACTELEGTQTYSDILIREGEALR